MNILYISPKLPFPPTVDGGKWRSYNQIKLLSKKHTVFSLSFTESEEELCKKTDLRKICRAETIVLPKWKSIWNSLIGLFLEKPLRVCYTNSEKMQSKVMDIIKREKIDLVFIQGIRMAYYLPENFTGKKVLDIVDCDSLQVARETAFSKGIWRQILKIELPRLKNFEKSIAENFDKTIAASADDARAFSEKTIVLANGEKKLKIGKRTKEKSILFVGNFCYKPNKDAVKFFCKKIFPKILEKEPEARFFVVGINPDKEIRKLANEKVVVTGFVERLEPYLEKAMVFVAPMRFGSGLQGKVIDAMHVGTTVVCTPIVNAGIGAKEGKEIMVADNAEKFAEKTIELLQNKKLNKKILKNAKKFAEKNFKWSVIGKKLDKILLFSL